MSLPKPNMGKEVIMSTEKCRECGANVPKGRSLISITCQILNLCHYCYGMKFPERKRHHLPSTRWLHNGRWIDLKPMMSWFREKPCVYEGEEEEVKESQKLLQEEIEEPR